MSTTVDVTAVVNSVIGLVLLGVIIPALKVAIPALLAHFKVSNAAALDAKIDAGLDAAGGQAYNYAIAHDADLTQIKTSNPSIAAGAQFFATHFASELAQSGMTDQALAERVSAHLGKLLAADPTVAPPSANV